MLIRHILERNTVFPDVWSLELATQLSEELNGIRFDRLSLDQAVNQICVSAKAGRGGTVVTPNFQMLALAAKNRDLQKVINSASISLCDSQFLYWISRLLRLGFPERAAGADLVPLVLREAERYGLRVGIFGGDAEDVKKVIQRIGSELPNLLVSTTLSPPVSAIPTREEVSRLARELSESRPNIVLMSFGFPKQELLSQVLSFRYPKGWFLNVGAGVAYFANPRTRAPRWVQSLGFEWFWRFLSDPQRLLHRYFILYPGYVPTFFWQLRGRSRTRS